MRVGKHHVADGCPGGARNGTPTSTEGCLQMARMNLASCRSDGRLSSTGLTPALSQEMCRKTLPDQTPLISPTVRVLRESHLAPPGGVENGGNSSTTPSTEVLIMIIWKFAVKSPTQMFVNEISAIWQERKKFLSDDPLLWPNKPLKQFIRVNSTRRTHSF